MNPTPAAGNTKALRVLAIEDNADFAQLFRHILEIMGCVLEVAGDARTGLELAQQSVPDLIFCDLRLPGTMDGFDFARVLRGDPGLQHIPLVGVSGYSGPEYRQQALLAGFDRLLPKPVKFADIQDALQTYSQGLRLEGT